MPWRSKNRFDIPKSRTFRPAFFVCGSAFAVRVINFKTVCYGSSEGSSGLFAGRPPVAGNQSLSESVERRRSRRIVAGRGGPSRPDRCAGGRACRSVGHRGVRTDGRKRRVYAAPEPRPPFGGGARASSGVRVHSRWGLGAGRLSHPQAAGARPCRGVGLCGGIRQLYAFARGAFSEGCRGGVCRSEMGGRKRPGDRGRRQPAGAGGQQRRR